MPCRLTRDELLRWINGTDPNRIGLDLRFFGTLITWLLPAAGIFSATVAPDAWQWLVSLLEPALRSIQ